MRGGRGIAASSWPSRCQVGNTMLAARGGAAASSTGLGCLVSRPSARAGRATGAGVRASGPRGLFLAGLPTPKPKPLRIAGRDTLLRREILSNQDKCFLIIDEAHRAMGDGYMKLIARFRERYRVVYILSSATPYRLDGNHWARSRTPWSSRRRRDSLWMRASSRASGSRASRQLTLMGCRCVAGTSRVPSWK